MPSDPGSLAARVAAAGRRCSPAGSPRAGWGTRGTPRQAGCLAEYPGAECAGGRAPGRRGRPGGAPCRRPRCPAATTGVGRPARPPRARRLPSPSLPGRHEDVVPVGNVGGGRTHMPGAPCAPCRRTMRQARLLAASSPAVRPGRARGGGSPGREPARLARAEPPGTGGLGLPGRLGVLRGAVAHDGHQPGVRQVGDRPRRRPDGRGGRRPRLPPREAAPVRGRVAPRRACARVGEGGGATAAGDGPGDGVVLRCTRGDIAALGDPGRALRHVSDDAMLSARCDGLPRDGTVDLWMGEVRRDGPDALGFVWCEAVLRPDGEPPGPSD